MRDSWNRNLEEAEEMRYRVRSAFREGLCFCATIGAVTRHSDSGSLLRDEGEQARTINLCQQCNIESLTAQGQVPLKSWQWKTMVEQKAHGGKLWKMLGKDQFFFFFKRCGNFCLERVKAKKFLEDAKQEKQEVIQRPMATGVSCQRSFGSS